MGTYLLIPKSKDRTIKLKQWFNKWKPFYNDFGDEHTFEDVFGELQYDGTIRFKIGVMDKEFYPKEAIEEIRAMGGKDE
mgnify:CR=1 FL=1